NRGYDAREKEPGDTDPNRKCACERLPRHDIAITNREASDEGEVQCVPDRPALDKANQQAEGNLNGQYHRQHRPRHIEGAAERHEKAPSHGLWCRRRRCRLAAPHPGIFAACACRREWRSAELVNQLHQRRALGRTASTSPSTASFEVAACVRASDASTNKPT